MKTDDPAGDVNISRVSHIDPVAKMYINVLANGATGTDR